MKILRLTGFLVTLASFASSKEVVAIIDVVNANNQVTALSSYIADDLDVKLTGSPDLTLVERGQLNKLLSEQGLQASGAFDEKTVAKIGSLCGATRVMFGKYYPIGDEYELITKTVDVVSGKVVKVEKSRMQKTESLTKLDAVVPNGQATSQAQQSPSEGGASGSTSSGPIRLMKCEAFSTPVSQGVSCTGEVVSPEGGVIQQELDQSSVFMDNGTKAAFQDALTIAGVRTYSVFPKIRQTFQMVIVTRGDEAFSNFSVFKYVYKFNGKTYTIDHPPVITRR